MGAKGTMKAARRNTSNANRRRARKKRRGLMTVMEVPTSSNPVTVDLLKESDTARCTEHMSRRRLARHINKIRKKTTKSRQKRSRRGKRLMEGPTMSSVIPAMVDLLKETDTARSTE